MGKWWYVAFIVSFLCLLGALVAKGADILFGKVVELPKWVNDSLVFALLCVASATQLGLVLFQKIKLDFAY